MDTFEGGACAMYAFEKEIPKISQTKLDGLAEFYEMTTDDSLNTSNYILRLTLDMQHHGEIFLKKSSTDCDNTD